MNSNLTAVIVAALGCAAGVGFFALARGSVLDAGALVAGVIVVIVSLRVAQRIAANAPE